MAGKRADNAGRRELIGSWKIRIGCMDVAGRAKFGNGTECSLGCWARAVGRARPLRSGRYRASGDAERERAEEGVRRGCGVI